MNVTKTQEVACRARMTRLIHAMGITEPMILDCGANFGQSLSKFKRAWANSTVHCFEPNPPTFDALEKAWGGKQGVFLNQKAISDKVGLTQFYVTKKPELASLLHPAKRVLDLGPDKRYSFDTVEVETTTIVAYCKQQDITAIDILKLDIQGMELAALHGAKDLLDREAISLIYIKTFFVENYNGQYKFAELLNFLHNHGGYQLWDMQPFLYTKADRLWVTNSIFISQSMAGLLEK